MKNKRKRWRCGNIISMPIEYESDTLSQNDPEMQRIQRQLEDENQQEGDICGFVLDKIVRTCPNLIEVGPPVACIRGYYSLQV